MALPKGSKKEVRRNMQGTIDRKKEAREIEITGLRPPSADCRKVLDLTKAVMDTGLNVHALIGKYKKVCGITHLEPSVIIDACTSYLKYRTGIRGKPWPYFIRILHTKHQTFKPKDVRGEVYSGPVSIEQILKNMGIAINIGRGV